MMQRRGFSLFEMLVVIAVLGVVTTLGMQAFSGITAHARTQALRAGLAASADRAFEAIARDAGNAAASARAGQAIGGGAASFTVPVEEETPSGAVQRMAAAYRVERTAMGTRLLRQAAPLAGSSGINSALGFSGVSAMQVAFFDGAAWRNDWTERTHPRALRVSLVLQDPNRPYEQIARQAEFAVNVP